MRDFKYCLNEACSKRHASVINGRDIGKTRLKKMGKLKGLRPYLKGTPLARGMYHNTKERNMVLIINKL